jgi:hypothetical protein
MMYGIDAPTADVLPPGDVADRVDPVQRDRKPAPIAVFRRVSTERSRPMPIRPAPARTLALIALLLLPRPAAAGTTWAWNDLAGWGFSVDGGGNQVPFTAEGGAISLTYDPATAPTGASLAVSPGTAPEPPVTFRSLVWTYDAPEPMLSGIAGDGARATVYFGPLGAIGYTASGWPDTMAGALGEPVRVDVFDSPSKLSYIYEITSAVPEPSGVVLMALGGLALLAGSRRRRRCSPVQPARPPRGFGRFSQDRICRT